MIKNVSAVAKFLEKSVREFTDIAVVGISGGVDSSVVASISVAALGRDNVHLVSMPYDEIDTTTFNARSAELAQKLAAHHHVVAIGESAKALEIALAKTFMGQPLDILTLANIRPRIRMSVLYGISGELGFKSGKRIRVMGTGHLSEDLIGYDTKGGDALCDIFILSDLVKSEVYQLAQHYSVPTTIVAAPPSAGLYAGQTDVKELGFDYDSLEKPTLALYSVIKRGLKPSEIHGSEPEFDGIDRTLVLFVVSRYKAHYHKHLAPLTVECRKAEWFS